MTSPPGYAPTTDDRRPVSSGDASDRDAYLTLLIRDARRADPALHELGRRDLLRLAREMADAKAADFDDLVKTVHRERSKLNPRAVVSNMAAHLAAVEDFAQFVARKRARLHASDPRIGGPSWRLTT